MAAPLAYDPRAPYQESRSTLSPGDFDEMGPFDDDLYEKYSPSDVRPLSPMEVLHIVQEEVRDARESVSSTEVNERRRRAMRAYYGREQGNEVEGRSQVTMRDVLEVIEWAMPSLMRMFTGGEQVVRFKATNDGQTHNAKLATHYINTIFSENGGFNLLYDWFKTALLEKNGYVRVFWEEKRHLETRSYKGQTVDEVQELLEQEGAEAISATTRTITGPDGVPIELIDLEMKLWTVIRQVRVVGIPPEEMLTARRMIQLDDDAAFCGQRVKHTVSDLVAMGFDIEEISKIPYDDSPEYSEGRYERLSEEERYPLANPDRTDVASRELWTVDCIIRIDEDGDGYSELRRILVAGENSGTMLLDEPVNQQEFVSITPVPTPHKHIGLSLADLVIDLQVIHTTLFRQVMDYLYLSVNPQRAIVEGQVRQEDLTIVRPGGVIRQRAAGMIENLALPPLPGETWQLFEYLENLRANRTGIMAHGQELNASAINQTATGMAQLMAEKQQKIELMARIFANGMKEMFGKMLRLVVENDTKEHQLEVNGEWMTFRPSEWDSHMQVEVEVGLGAGAAIERREALLGITQLQEKHVSNGGLNYTVTPQNLYNSAAALTEAAGFKDTGTFFQDPEGREPPEPEPNPDMVKLELESKKAEAADQIKMKELELAMFKERALVEHRAADLASKERIELKRIDSNELIALGNQDATIRSALIAQEGNDTEDEEPEDQAA